MNFTKITILIAGSMLTVAYAYIADVSSFFSTRIVGGLDAPIGFAPHMVALVVGNRVRSLMCGASVVNKRVVLTAAHCIDALLEPNRQLLPTLRGTHSSNFWASTADQVKFDSYKKHPQYDAWNIKFDIAVLIAKTFIVFSELVQPIRLRFAWVGGGEQAFLTGWGLTVQPDDRGNVHPEAVPATLQMLQVLTISGRRCSEGVELGALVWGPAPRADPDVEICTRRSPGHGACMGDSGSALVLKRTGEQIGVVSWGFPCNAGMPSMNTRISTMKPFLLPYLTEDLPKILEAKQKHWYNKWLSYGSTKSKLRLEKGKTKLRLEVDWSEPKKRYKVLIEESGDIDSFY